MKPGYQQAELFPGNLATPPGPASYGAWELGLPQCFRGVAGRRIVHPWYPRSLVQLTLPFTGGVEDLLFPRVRVRLR